MSDKNRNGKPTDYQRKLLRAYGCHSAFKTYRDAENAIKRYQRKKGKLSLDCKKPSRQPLTVERISSISDSAILAYLLKKIIALVLAELGKKASKELLSLIAKAKKVLAERAKK